MAGTIEPAFEPENKPKELVLPSRIRVIRTASAPVYYIPVQMVSLPRLASNISVSGY
jgi:hypothetical protein